MRINRRTLLIAGSIGVSPALAASAPPPVVTGPRFEHGIASGDPLADRVILWTRLSGVSGDTEVKWQMARDPGFTDIAAQGAMTATADRDFTIKADVAGLVPDTDYVYRFVAGEVTSPIGRTRTLPLDTDKVVLAVVSCSLHANGYFNAYRAIADLPHVDAVVHLGDYIYEYGAGLTDYGMGNGRVLDRIPEPPHEIITLDDYRTRHAQYKSDADLQAAHARAPWICVFDDHEICNNPWTGGAENHNPDKGEGDWWARKAAALKAYREWMPIRDPAPGQLAEDVYRSFRFGTMAELVMIETRLVARTKQLDYMADLKVDGVPDFDALRARLNDPARELLGAQQRAWLAAILQSSVQAGVRWQILGNQVVIAKVSGPDIVKVFGADTVDTVTASLPDAVKTNVEAMVGLFSRPDPFPFNLDAWDGYPAERERLYDIVKQAGARMVVVSGDSHTAWANQLHDAAGQPVAVEIGVTSVTSPTRFLDAWLPDLKLAATLAEQNAEVIAADDDHNGFVLLTLAEDEMTADWMAVSTIMSRDFTLLPRRRFAMPAQPRTGEWLTAL